MCITCSVLAQRVLVLCSCCVVISLQVFIPIYTGFERRWELAGTSTCLALKLWFFTINLLPDLIIVLWRTNFKSIPLETEQCLQKYYCYPCLDLETSCRDGGCRGMRRVSGCTLRTLYFVNSVKLLVKWLLMRCFW